MVVVAAAAAAATMMMSLSFFLLTIAIYTQKNINARILFLFVYAFFTQKLKSLTLPHRYMYMCFLIMCASEHTLDFDLFKCASYIINSVFFFQISTSIICG